MSPIGALRRAAALSRREGKALADFEQARTTFLYIVKGAISEQHGASLEEAALVRETISIGGVRLGIDQQVMSNRMIDVLRSGRYERAEASQIAKIVEAGERIVELGGGLGYIAILAAKEGKAESIAIYEANPKLIPLIEENRTINQVEFEVFNEVVLPAAGPESVPFYIRRDFWASSLAPEPWGYVEKVDVSTKTFADMLSLHRPTLLIVDIEGGELALFRDIRLTGIQKIYIELHQKVIGRQGMKEVFDFFSSRGFHYDQDHSQGGVILFSHVLR